MTVALPRIASKDSNCWMAFIWPPATRQSTGRRQQNKQTATVWTDEVPLVSNFWPEGVAVQMMGLRPIAFEMARTRLSANVQSALRDERETGGRTDIAVGRTHRSGSDTEDSLNRLTSPAKLSDDLLVRQRRERLRKTKLAEVSWMIARPYVVRPGVHTDLVTLHVLLDKDSGALNSTGADDEEGRVQIFRVQEIKKSSSGNQLQRGIKMPSAS